MMEFLATGAVAFILIAVHMAKGRAWKEVGRELGLEVTSPPLFGKSLRGSLRGFGILVDEKSSRQESRVVARVQGVDLDFTLGRDSAFARLLKPDFQIGDQVFDENVRIEGSSEWALALLGDSARGLAQTLITDASGSISDHQIQAQAKTVRDVPGLLETMLELAELLDRPGDRELPALLSRRALEDSSRGVRLQAIRMLAASYPRSAETLETARELIKSLEPPLRLEACRVLLRGDTDEGERAAEVLVKLALAGRLESSMRRTALELLARSRFRAVGIPAMATLLEAPGSEPTEVRRAAIEGLVRARARDELLRLEPPLDGAEAEQLARGLGQLGDVAAQRQLLALLGHSEDRVRAAAVQALGAVGDLGAVVPLRQVASMGSLFRSAVARAAETAIAEIQGRAGGSQAGEISLVAVSPLEGAVSATDDADEGGEVSLAS